MKSPIPKHSWSRGSNIPSVVSESMGNSENSNTLFPVVNSIDCKEETVNGEFLLHNASILNEADNTNDSKSIVSIDDELAPFSYLTNCGDILFPSLEDFDDQTEYGSTAYHIGIIDENSPGNVRLGDDVHPRSGRHGKGRRVKPQISSPVLSGKDKSLKGSKHSLEGHELPIKRRKTSNNVVFNSPSLRANVSNDEIKYQSPKTPAQVHHGDQVLSPDARLSLASSLKYDFMNGEPDLSEFPQLRLSSRTKALSQFLVHANAPSELILPLHLSPSMLYPPVLLSSGRVISSFRGLSIRARRTWSRAVELMEGTLPTIVASRLAAVPGSAASSSVLAATNKEGKILQGRPLEAGVLLVLHLYSMSSSVNSHPNDETLHVLAFTNTSSVSAPFLSSASTTSLSSSSQSGSSRANVNSNNNNNNTYASASTSVIVNKTKCSSVNDVTIVIVRASVAALLIEYSRRRQNTSSLMVELPRSLFPIHSQPASSSISKQSEGAMKDTGMGLPFGAFQARDMSTSLAIEVPLLSDVPLFLLTRSHRDALDFFIDLVPMRAGTIVALHKRFDCVHSAASPVATAASPAVNPLTQSPSHRPSVGSIEMSSTGIADLPDTEDFNKMSNVSSESCDFPTSNDTDISHHSCLHLNEKSSSPILASSPSQSHITKVESDSMITSDIIFNEMREIWNLRFPKDRLFTPTEALDITKVFRETINSFADRN